MRELSHGPDGSVTLVKKTSVSLKTSALSAITIQLHPNPFDFTNAS